MQASALKPATSAISTKLCGTLTVAALPCPAVHGVLLKQAGVTLLLNPTALLPEVAFELQDGWAAVLWHHTQQPDEAVPCNVQRCK